MHSRWDNIGIDRYSCSYIGFIVGTIKYDNYCVIKLSFLDILIIDYLGAIFILISFSLIRPNAIL